MSYRITENNFEKIYVLTRMVADLNNRLANEGNNTHTVWMTLSGNVNSVELGVLYSPKNVTREVLGSYDWYYDDAIKSSTYEGAKEFLQEWEQKLFAVKEVDEEKEWSHFKQKASETWRSPVYECVKCGQEFMNDRSLPHWCPNCGRALDWDQIENEEEN